jgi:hypothetical protein
MTTQQNLLNATYAIIKFTCKETLKTINLPNMQTKPTTSKILRNKQLYATKLRIQLKYC